MPKVSLLTCLEKDKLTVIGIYMNALRARFEYFECLQNVLQEFASRELKSLNDNFGFYYTPSLCDKYVELYQEKVQFDDTLPIYELREGVAINQ